MPRFYCPAHRSYIQFYRRSASTPVDQLFYVPDPVSLCPTVSSQKEERRRDFLFRPLTQLLCVYRHRGFIQHYHLPLGKLTSN